MRLSELANNMVRQSADPRAYISDLGMVAKTLMLARAEGRPAAGIAEGFKASADVVAIVKAAIGAVSLIDFPPYAAAIASFLESLRSRSVFARLLAEGMRRAPLQTPIRAVGVAVSGTTKSDGYPTPVSRMVLTAPLLARLQAVALIALTRELVEGTTPAALAFLEAELRNAVSTAMDAAFITIITTGAPSIASTGTDSDAALLDLRSLLAQVNATGAGELFWVVSPDVANRASTLAGLAGSLLFADMGPSGGSMLNVTALVSDQVPAGQVVLIDAAGLVGDVDSIDVVASQHAALQLRDDPTNAAAELTSMWQANAVATRATVGFGLERFRANAVARLTGVAWGGSTPTS
jgi:HK97 family phage major capsid protein